MDCNIYCKNTLLNKYYFKSGRPGQCNKTMIKLRNVKNNNDDNYITELKNYIDDSILKNGGSSISAVIELGNSINTIQIKKSYNIKNLAICIELVNPIPSCLSTNFSDGYIIIKKNSLSIHDWLCGKNIPTLPKENSHKFIYRTSILELCPNGNLSHIEPEITFGNGNQNDVITEKLSNRVVNPNAFRYIDKDKTIDRFTGNQERFIAIRGQSGGKYAPIPPILIIPNPELIPEVQYKFYEDISTFMRNVELSIQNALWKKVAEVSIDMFNGFQNTTNANEQLQQYSRIWINTQGFGIPWLHIRLDPVPKYYTSPRTQLGQKEIERYNNQPLENILLPLN